MQILNILIKNKHTIFIFIIVLLFLSNTIDRIVATVGDRPILQSELKNGVNFIEKSPFFPVSQKDSLIKTYKKDFIDQIILDNIAKKDSITIDSQLIMKDVTTKIHEMIKNNFPDSQAFNNFLKDNSINIKDLKHFYYSQLKTSFLKQRIIIKNNITINVSASEIKNFYEANRDSFKIPLNVDLYHIAFIIQVDSMTLMSNMQKVDALIKLLKSGKSFSEVARQYSDDIRTQKNGGIVDYIKYSDLPQEIANFLFMYRNADTLIYTQSRQGFHIIKILDAKRDKIRYQQILVGFSPNREDSLRALNKAKGVYNKLKNKQITFEDAAKQYSEDPSTKNNGGYIGKIPVASLQKDVRNVLEKLNNNEFSDILTSNFGYEIFMIKNKQGGYVSSYLDVANIIKMILENKKLDIEIKKIIDKEKKNLFVNFIDE